MDLEVGCGERQYKMKKTALMVHGCRARMWQKQSNNPAENGRFIADARHETQFARARST
jgi:hypothetical protein